MQVTPVVSVQQGAPITSESLSTDAKLILEEVIRYLNLEKMLSSYRFTVTCSCLKTIRILQKYGHLPSKSQFFKFYASYGQYIGKFNLIEHYVIYHVNQLELVNRVLYKSEYNLNALGGREKK